MKIGIITFHFAFNYGAALQAFAMQEHLCSMGHDAFIIDYSPEYHTKIYSHGRTWKSCFQLPIWRFPLRIMAKIFRNYDKQRSKNFITFSKKYFRLYPYNPNSDFSEFDCILLGSDQIWRQDITNNTFDGPYYGDGFKCRVFSYAASNRATTLNEEDANNYRAKLNQLTHIGVREPMLQALLQPLTDKKVNLNVDPTLLAGTEVYASMNLQRLEHEKYILLYMIPHRPEVFCLAKKYAEQNNLKLICLVDLPNSRLTKYYDQIAGPKEFLSYIKYAECIFTTSFHGTALSLLFNKQFYSVRQHTNADIRLESILEQVGLIDRFIEVESSPIPKEIDYSTVNSKLSELRVVSQTYLESAIINE